MKCTFTIIDENRNVSSLVIEKNKVYFQELDEASSLLNIDEEACVNTLISLYSLKNRWENTEEGIPNYIVTFGENEEVYEFDTNNLPDNWPLFMGFLNRLVGDVI